MKFMKEQLNDLLETLTTVKMVQRGDFYGFEKDRKSSGSKCVDSGYG